MTTDTGRGTPLLRRWCDSLPAVPAPADPQSRNGNLIAEHANDLLHPPTVDLDHHHGGGISVTVLKSPFIPDRANAIWVPERSPQTSVRLFSRER